MDTYMSLHGPKALFLWVPYTSKFVYQVLSALDPTDPMKNGTFVYKNVQKYDKITF